jgi:hypothetical protein
MLKVLSFLIVTLLTLPACINWGTKVSGTAKAEAGAMSFSGKAELRDTSYEKLSISGAGILNNVKVTKSLSARGSLRAKESTIETLKSSGSTKLEKTTIHGLCKISGSFTAASSKFAEISASATRITLSDSQTKTITIKKPSSPVEQIVDLYNTKVDGDIIFEGGNGKVLLRGNSKITGKVIGGTV